MYISENQEDNKVDIGVQGILFADKSTKMDSSGAKMDTSSAKMDTSADSKEKRMRPEELDQLVLEYCKDE